jgi:hypothetical protein
LAAQLYFNAVFLRNGFFDRRRIFNAGTRNRHWEHSFFDGIFRTEEGAVPFSKMRVEPSQLPVMRAAFDKVCTALGLTCEMDDPLTDLVALTIIAHAQQGDLDAIQLCDRTLRDLQPPQQASAEQASAAA